MGEQIIFRGDHGLVVTMSKEMYQKAVNVRREGKYYVITIETEEWNEIIEEDNCLYF